MKLLIILATITLLAALIWIRFKGIIGDGAFGTSFCFSVFLGIALYSHDRLESLGITGVKLAKIENTEKSVKALALAILEVLDKGSHGLMFDSFDSGAYEKAVEDLKKLAK